MLTNTRHVKESQILEIAYYHRLITVRKYGVVRGNSNFCLISQNFSMVSCLCFMLRSPPHTCLMAAHIPWLCLKSQQSLCSAKNMLQSYLVLGKQLGGGVTITSIVC